MAAPKKTVGQSFGVGAAFMGVGAAFMALGATGQNAFFGVGGVFLALGTVFMVRGSRMRTVKKDEEQ